MITIDPPKALNRSDAKRLRDVFLAAEYTEANLRERSGLLVPPPQEIVPPSVVGAVTDSGGPFACLATWFFLGMPVKLESAEALLPGSFIQLCLDHGLLRQEGPGLIPVVLITPVQDALLASDLQLMQSQDEEHYVPTVCDAALHLNSVAIRHPVDRVLDLCGGFSMHGVLASRHAREVVTTDLNPRAEAFARFNASLNGCENVTAVTGNLFESVQGQKFDLILSNPPFIICPESVTTYRFNPMALDGFVCQMLSQVPHYLNEGGILQTICEWVEIEGVDWQERLSQWFHDSGCDVWMLPANRQLPGTYAESALKQTITDPVILQAKRAEWQCYFESKNVTAIQGGFIFVRRREGANWVDVTQLTKPIRQPIGDSIAQGFASRDVLFASDADQRLLQSKPVLAPGLRQVEESTWNGLRWENDSITLHLEKGLPITVGVDKYVRTLIEHFDGTNVVADALIDFSRQIGLPIESGCQQGLQIAKAMIRSGILLLHAGPSHPVSATTETQNTSDGHSQTNS